MLFPASLSKSVCLFSMIFSSSSVYVCVYAPRIVCRRTRMLRCINTSIIMIIITNSLNRFLKRLQRWPQTSVQTDTLLPQSHSYLQRNFDPAAPTVATCAHRQECNNGAPPYSAQQDRKIYVSIGFRGAAGRKHKAAY